MCGAIKSHVRIDNAEFQLHVIVKFVLALRF